MHACILGLYGDTIPVSFFKVNFLCIFIVVEVDISVFDGTFYNTICGNLRM
jgi:hypothetical protein